MPDRAAIVVQHLAPHFHAAHALLEIGAGEGRIAETLRNATQAQLTLVDVVDYNRTNMPLQTYDGVTLPFANAAFDYSLLVFVLHHTPDPRVVLREALRVARLGVVVVENHVEGRLRRHITRAIDSIPHYHYGVPVCHHTYSIDDWQRLFAPLAARYELLSRFSMGGGFWQNFVMRLRK